MRPSSNTLKGGRWLAWAYQEQGDQARAGELFQEVANLNTLPALNYSFVRAMAKKMKA
ncbi:MAG TPA: hypothetical protein VGP44_04985 [Gemmatimonadales bacterium]|nr:hypothetical protein [Gemmatimonadales bacterium]